MNDRYFVLKKVLEKKTATKNLIKVNMRAIKIDISNGFYASPNIISNKVLEFFFKLYVVYDNLINLNDDIS